MSNGNSVRGGLEARRVERRRRVVRRRRLLVGLGVVTAAWATVGGGVALADQSHVVVVRQGETLWDIAAAHADGASTAVALTRIAAVNHLERLDVVYPGQEITLP